MDYVVEYSVNGEIKEEVVSFEDFYSDFIEDFILDKLEISYINSSKKLILICYSYIFYC